MVEIVRRVTKLVGDSANRITDIARGILGGSKKTRRQGPEPSREEQGDKGESEKEQ